MAMANFNDLPIDGSYGTFDLNITTAPGSFLTGEPGVEIESGGTWSAITSGTSGTGTAALIDPNAGKPPRLVGGPSGGSGVIHLRAKLADPAHCAVNEQVRISFPEAQLLVPNGSTLSIGGAAQVKITAPDQFIGGAYNAAYPPPCAALPTPTNPTTSRPAPPTQAKPSTPQPRTTPTSVATPAAIGSIAPQPTSPAASSVTSATAPGSTPSASDAQTQTQTPSAIATTPSTPVSPRTTPVAATTAHSSSALIWTVIAVAAAGCAFGTALVVRRRKTASSRG